MIRRYTKNTHGRDFIIGDIHGQFSRVDRHLENIGFDESVDRLFSVGDLIDRGDESHLVPDWLAKPWFHAVRGNHEEFAIQYQQIDKRLWLINGGSWFFELDEQKQSEISCLLAALPFAIELETEKGVVGIVHADAPCRLWGDIYSYLLTGHGKEHCLWSRERIDSGRDDGVHGVRAVVVGHTPDTSVRTLGNVIYIDTGGWIGVEGGRYSFTTLNAATLEPAT